MKTPSNHPLSAFAIAIVLTALAHTASAQLLHHYWNGSAWVTDTISSAPHSVVGSNSQSYSVYAGNATAVQRWDTVNTTPAVGQTYSGSFDEVVLNPAPGGNFSFTRSGTIATRFNAGGGLETISGAAWAKISSVQYNGAVNTMLGLSSNGSIGRIYFDGGSSSWVTDIGSALGNSNTGYTSIASDGSYPAGQLFYSSGPGKGLDRTYWNGASWVFDDNIAAIDFDLLAYSPNTANAVFGVNSSGLSQVVFDGSNWVTNSINTHSYTALFADDQLTNVLFGIRAGSVDQIYYDTGISAWITQSISAGTFGGIADNIGVANSMFLIVPEPSSAALLAMAAGSIALLRRRRK